MIFKYCAGYQDQIETTALYPNPKRFVSAKQGGAVVDGTLLKQELMAKIEAEVEKFLGKEATAGTAILADMEQEARELAVRMGGMALQGIVTRRAASAERGYRGAVVNCPEPGCPSKLKFMDYRPRPTRTYLGEVEYSRAYYWGAICGHSWCPLDEDLRMVEGPFSPLLKDGIGVASALDTFRGGADQLERFALVDISPTAVRTNGEDVGRALVEKAQNAATEAWTFDGGKDGEKSMPERAKDAPPKHGVVMLDGTMIPVIKEDTPAEKKADGKKSSQREREEDETERGYREVKVGMVFRDEDWVRPDDPKGRGQILDKEYVAWMGSKEEFAPLLWEVIRSWRVDEAPKQTALGDGAKWIWDLVTMFLPTAAQVVDAWHLSERINDTAKAVYGEANPFATKWAKARYEAILDRGTTAVDELTAALDGLQPRGADAKKEVSELRTYLTNNKHRMAYDVFRAEGRPISSAPMEGANEHLVSKRMEVSGARWTPEDANAILASRCAYFSRRWDEPRPRLVA